ncbi:MAG: NAD(+) synthase, partial [Promethearchaeota archaeon]
MRELDYKDIITEIQKWIKEYIISANVNGVVIGISGGIDSAVTTTLCVKALGKKNVIGLGLPCSSNPQDLKDTKKLVAILGINFIILDLTSVYNEFLKISTPLFESNQIAIANLKPRLRMMSIYFVGQSLGKFLVAGT